MGEGRGAVGRPLPVATVYLEVSRGRMISCKWYRNFSQALDPTAVASSDPLSRMPYRRVISCRLLQAQVCLIEVLGTEMVAYLNKM